MAMILTALLIALGHSLVLSQNTCGPIGNGDETRLTARRDQRFYLDVNHPAPCAGNVTSWTVCYYAPNTVENYRIYWAFYAIYRRNVSENGGRYERVSDIFAAIRTGGKYITTPRIDGVIVPGEFSCYDDTIDNGNSLLTVQAGDVLGACVFDPPDVQEIVERLQLDIVGEVSGESLLKMDSNECNLISPGLVREIPSSIEMSQLSTISSRRLHLYANIDPHLKEAFSTQEITTIASSSENQDTENQSVLELVAITTGPVCGGLVVLVITVSLTVIVLNAVCFKNKPIVMEETTPNVAECTVNTVKYYNNIIVTEDNTAYGCSQLDPVVPVELIYETIDLEESTTEAQQSTDEPLTSVNAACEETEVNLPLNTSCT